MLPKINSSHGSETRNIINAAIDSINVQGKSIQDLVAEGQLTLEQYAELITIINSNLKSGEVGKFELTPELRLEVNRISEKINKGNVTESDIAGTLRTLVNSIPNKINRGEVTFNDVDINKGKLLPKHASEELLSMIAGNAPINAVPADGSITNIKLANKAVGPGKTTMFEKSGKNLLDVEQLINAYTDWNTGEVIEHETYKLTPLIKITPSTNILINRAVRGYVFYTANYSFVSSKTDLVANEVIKSPSNAEYMRVTLYGSTDFSEAQIELGTTPTEYEPPYSLKEDYIKTVKGEIITEKSIGIDKLDFSIISETNIFNFPNDLEKEIVYASPEDGSLSTSTPPYNFKVTKPLDVIANSKYISNGRIRSIAFYNNTGTFLNGLPNLIEPGNPFTTPSGAAVMRVNFYSSNDMKEVQIENSTSLSPYEPGSYIESFVAPKSVTPNKLSDEVLSMFDGGSNNWIGKSFVSLGTSIPWYDGKKFPDGTLAKGYQSHLKEQLGFSYFENAAVSGSPMANGTSASQSTNTKGKNVSYNDFDLVIIEAGSNDYKLDVPLGTRGIASDTTFDTNTFYGAYRDLIQYILAQKPSIRIVLFTPPRRKQTGFTDEQKNTDNKVMFDYVKAVLDIAELYGLPVVDFWHESGFNWQNATYFTIDGVHPNNIGFERLGDVAVGRIRNI